MLASFIVDGLRASGSFSAVFDDTAPYAPRYNLRCALRRFESEEDRERLYDAVYQSDTWKNDIGPRVGDLIDREQIKVTRLEATSKSVLR